MFDETKFLNVPRHKFIFQDTIAYGFWNVFLETKYILLRV